MNKNKEKQNAMKTKEEQRHKLDGDLLIETLIKCQ